MAMDDLHTMTAAIQADIHRVGASAAQPHNFLLQVNRQTPPFRIIDTERVQLAIAKAPKRLVASGISASIDARNIAHRRGARSRPKLI